jgi:hypothetical protein
MLIGQAIDAYERGDLQRAHELFDRAAATGGKQQLRTLRATAPPRAYGKLRPSGCQAPAAVRSGSRSCRPVDDLGRTTAALAGADRSHSAQHPCHGGLVA